MKIDYKKLQRITKELKEELERSHKSCTAMEATTQQITLKDGRQAQIRVIINTDEDDFDEIAN